MCQRFGMVNFQRSLWVLLHLTKNTSFYNYTVAILPLISVAHKIAMLSVGY